jgi:Zn-dependent metalloprotease
MPGHRCSIQCIIPPHMLENIVRNGSAEQRATALTTLVRDATLRARRVHRSHRRPGEQEGAAAEAGSPVRSIYDLGGSESAPTGQPARSEGDQPSGDDAVDEAYDGFGDTYSFYWDVFQRDSIDNKGLPLVGWVHYGQDYDNAFWDGQRMVFGDGDGSLFVRFTKSLDVIGHELTHGVTETEAALDYFDQSGALNESISDVFGSLVRQKTLGQTADQADWLIGKDVLGPDVNGVAIRSMKAPGTAYDDPVLGQDPQVASFKDYVDTADDNGGVHTNSGIPNHAFYLAAVAIGGNAWEKAGKIWYQTLLDDALKTDATFSDFAGITLRVARALYGDSGAEAEAVAQCWAGVDVSPTSTI